MASNEARTYSSDPKKTAAYTILAQATQLLQVSRIIHEIERTPIFQRIIVSLT